jgi:hypothetical protein
MLAFDFDADGDPGTIQSDVEATPGEVLVANLVLSSIPNAHPWLRGAQFGIALTDGLEFLTMSGPDASALFLQDDLDGIAVIFTDAIPVEELPVVIMRFAVRVTDESEQSMEVVPSTGWGVTYENFLLSLADGPYDENHFLYESAAAIPHQRRARVNEEPESDPTPDGPDTWSGVKQKYAR